MMVRAAAPDLCWLCRKPVKGHKPCAICLSTNAYMDLCAHCRHDPANRGWSRTQDNLGFEEDVAADERHVYEQRVYDLGMKPIQDESPIVAEILRLFFVGTMSMRMIAANVGRSKSFVEYVYRTRVQKRKKSRNTLRRQ